MRHDRHRRRRRAGGVRVFSTRFYQLLTDFLLFIIVWVGPWCAIYLVDYWLRRGRYDTAALQNEKGGLYFRSNGVNWSALISLAIGMVAAALWLNAYSPYARPCRAASETRTSASSWG